MLINVPDYGGIGAGGDPVQAALNAAVEGDRIYFPGIVPYAAPTNGWLIDKSLELFGDLDGVITNTPKGTLLQQANATGPVFKVVPPATHVHLHDLRLQGPGSGSGSGIGIHCQSTANAVLEEMRFHRLFVEGFRGHGIHLEGVHAVAGRIHGASVFDCIVRNCGGAGLSMLNADNVMLAGTWFKSNQLSGLVANTSDVALYQCGFESNSLAAGLGALDANLRLDNCAIARVDACRFINFDQGPVKKAIVLNGGGGGMVDACYFEVPVGTGREGIVVTGTDAGPFAILSNRFKEVNVLIRIDSGVRDCVLLPQYSDSAAGVGTIVLPYPNNGMYGAPHIVRPGGVEMGGLLLPSAQVDPTFGLRDGMLAYNTAASRLRAYVDGRWQVPQTLP